jgi:hypothetical protein
LKNKSGYNFLRILENYISYQILCMRNSKEN